MEIILASGSPRRKDLLKSIVPDFKIIVSDADETLKEGITPEEQATRLSYIKAKTVFDKTEGDRIVIGSDTMVVKNNKIYGKPKNKEQAKLMIKDLLKDDRKHKVVTGLCVMIENNKEYHEFNLYDSTIVYFTEISDREINNWVNTGKAMDKAGAYAMQDEFGVFIEKIDGNYSTVIGLPIHKLYGIIKRYINN